MQFDSINIRDSRGIENNNKDNFNKV